MNSNECLDYLREKGILKKLTIDDINEVLYCLHHIKK
jgi:hypothetical protein